MDLQTFQQKLDQLDHPVVIDVWAPWCGPCKMLAPVLDRVKVEYDGRVELININADESRDVISALGVYAIPTLLVFRGGQEITRATGVQSQAGLRQLFEAGLNGERPSAPTGLSMFDRLLRISLGLAVIWLTWNFQVTPLLYFGGAVLLFSAIYDRCPIWQALSPRLAQLFRIS